jgi:hypothetical protein
LALELGLIVRRSNIDPSLIETNLLDNTKISPSLNLNFENIIVSKRLNFFFLVLILIGFTIINKII